MVDLGGITNLAGNIMNIVIIIIAILVIGGAVVGIYWLVLKQKKYREYKCIIWKPNDKGYITNESYDSGGVFVDRKTNNKRLFIKKTNVGLSPDKIPYITTSKGQKIVYLLQTGLKNLRPITPPQISEDKLNFKVGEEDVNWGINAYESQKKTFTQSMLLQYMPYIALAFVSMIILIMFMYFFKNFDTLKDVAVAMQESARVLAQSRTGIVVS